MSLVSCKELYHYKDDDVYPNRVIIAVLWIEQQQLLYFVFSFFFHFLSDFKNNSFGI